jgi:signal transduction histidine kinase
VSRRGPREIVLFASLRVRLLLPVLVAVVPTVAFFLGSAREQRRLLVEEASGGATRLAQLVAERHQRKLDAAHGLLLAVSRMRAVATLDGPACSASVEPLLGLEPVFINVGATTPDGRVFCSAAPVPGKVNLADRAFYREAIRTRGLGVGEYVISRIRGTGAVGFGYPVERDGKLVALAFASLATGKLQEDLEALELPAGTQVAVLDRTGVTLTARPDAARWTGKAFDPSLVQQVRAARGPVALDGADGLRRLYDVKVVAAPDGTAAMSVVAGLPLGAVVDPVNRATTRALVWSLVAIALAIALAILAGELSIVRRLRRIADAARALAAGDLTARAGVPSRDEIGGLAARFDDMARALEELDREKKHRDDQLRQAQKMEAVGQLAGGIAHDFNNLLTVVLSAGTALRERLEDDDVGQQDIREILDAAERAAALTRQLLAFSRRQHVAPRVVDVCETVGGLERMLRRVLGEDVKLAVDVRGPALIHADPSQLELAVLNLAVNARDAMPRGGTLGVEVRPVPSEGPAHPAGEDVPAGPLVLVAVRDTGSGIDPATRARMFEPFFTTKRSGRGTGLGLPIVQGVVADCGGVIRVESELGKGTEFRLYFPARAGEVREAPPPEAAEAPRGSETVLVIEDDPHLRGVIRRALTEHGYVVRAVGTAADARALEGPAPDLLLTDVILPDGNGIDLSHDLAERWPAAGVLYMSGYAGEHLEAVGTLPPEASLVPKPFSTDVLLVRVREVLGRRRAA